MKPRLQPGYAFTSTRRYPILPDLVVVGETECIQARYGGEQRLYQEVPGTGVFRRFRLGRRYYWQSATTVPQAQSGCEHWRPDQAWPTHIIGLARGVIHDGQRWEMLHDALLEIGLAHCACRLEKEAKASGEYDPYSMFRTFGTPARKYCRSWLLGYILGDQYDGWPDCLSREQETRNLEEAKPVWLWCREMVEYLANRGSKDCQEALRKVGDL